MDQGGGRDLGYRDDGQGDTVNGKRARAIRKVAVFYAQQLRHLPPKSIARRMRRVFTRSRNKRIELKGMFR